ncbi:MAG: hypothetical protein RL839_16880 [Gammaproteobacteria bacterium]
MTLLRLLLLVLTTCTLAACGSSASYEERLAEFNRTIPSCSSEADCNRKWQAARQWVIENADFQLRTDSEDRIDTLNSNSTRSGTSIQVDRVPLGNDTYRIVVDVECFAAYGCPNELDKRLEFNRLLNNLNG